MLREQLAERARTSSPDEIERACLSIIEENLALLCVLHFEVVTPSKAAVGKSLAINDAFAAVVLFLEVVLRKWTTSEPTNDRPRREWRACLDAIADALLKIEEKSGEPVAAVERELVGAYFLSLALLNDWRHRPLLDGLRYDVFLGSDLCGKLRTKTSLEATTTAVREDLDQA